MMLGGADLELLEEAPSDKNEFVARGLSALVPALFAFAAFTIAGAVIALTVWLGVPVGVIWAVVVLVLDVSLLTSLVGADTKQRIRLLLIRGCVSLLAAYVCAQFILIAVFHQDIVPQMVRNQVEAAQDYAENVVGPQYEADKTAAETTLANGQKELDAAAAKTEELLQKVNAANITLRCEVGGINDPGDCEGTTGDRGFGDEAEVAQSQLRAAESELALAQAAERASQARLGPEMEAARATLARIESSVAADKSAAMERQLADQGLIARWEALDDLREKSWAVDVFAWALEALLVAIDLMAVIAAVTSKTPAYSRIVRAKEVEADIRAGLIETEAQLASRVREAEITTEMAPALVTILAAKRQAAAEELRDQLAAIGRERQLAEARADLRGDVARAEADGDIVSSIARHEAARVERVMSGRGAMGADGSPFYWRGPVTDTRVA
ncbi:DUF4407 domain-containing protein [Candidatus Saccharibacteria bacterium]|nr:DUF4407 domain-containing protein [Candidatus Saccharibacteria bacterium]